MALLILCEPTSHSTNIYISRSTSRCEVFGTFLHFIRRLLPPSGNDTSALAEGNTRGFCKRTDAYKRMTALYVSFIFPGVFTVYCCPLFTVYCLLFTDVRCLHKILVGDANTILPARSPNCLQVFLCKSTEFFKYVWFRCSDRKIVAYKSKIS